jgi:hypothetical protein
MNIQVVGDVLQTNSPSMDIQAPYNIERMLYYASSLLIIVIYP